MAAHLRGEACLPSHQDGSHGGTRQGRRKGSIKARHLCLIQMLGPRADFFSDGAQAAPPGTRGRKVAEDPPVESRGTEQTSLLGNLLLQPGLDPASVMSYHLVPKSSHMHTHTAGQTDKTKYTPPQKLRPHVYSDQLDFPPESIN